MRGVIGKGGMFAKTRQGLIDHGAVYLHAVGGTAQSLARAVVRVERVFKLEEFGVPEAMWVIEVKDFPTVVTMDAQGGSLHDTVAAQSKATLDKLLGR
jgi:fumarate hydratase subunit beta